MSASARELDGGAGFDMEQGHDVLLICATFWRHGRSTSTTRSASARELRERVQRRTYWPIDGRSTGFAISKLVFLLVGTQKSKITKISVILDFFWPNFFNF